MSDSFAKRPALALAATLALGSAVVVIPAAPSLAAPASASHATIARTAAVSAVKTQWAWGNGTALKAKELTPTALSASSYYLRVDRNQGHVVQLVGTLPNGHGVGIDDQGRLREYTKAGPQAFQRGRTAPLYTAVVRGSVVYGISVDGELLRFTGAGARAANLGKPAGLVSGSPAISGSRIYWTRYVSAGAGKLRNEVVSRALSGGATKVVAKDARDPRVTDAGLLVVRTGPAYGAQDYDAMYTVRGIDVIGSKGAKRLLTFKGAGLGSQIGDGPWTVDASGRTLTLSAAGTSGQLVINLKTRQAWRINVPKGTVPSWTGVSGARAVWDVRDGGGEARGKGVYIMNVDTGKAQLLKTKTGSLNTPVVNGKAIAWTYDRPDGLVQFKSIVLK
ncbi:hypothetical protein [Galactobacter valiniphilus]|uniref:hypothetical protein n=1 Tax=Galactobacter valiniphilus TaxID=2676122 RepID=UPI003735DFA7